MTVSLRKPPKLLTPSNSVPALRPGPHWPGSGEQDVEDDSFKKQHTMDGGHSSGFSAFLEYFKSDTTFVQGSLEVKLPTIWTDGKASQGEAQACRKSEGRRQEMEKIRNGDSQKREDAGARKGMKVAEHRVFSNVLWLPRVEK